MYNLDRYAGDDDYVFLGKFAYASDYGDHGLVFPTKRLINKYDALISNVDLFEDYQELSLIHI